MVLAMSWLAGSVWIAGFLFAFLTIAAVGTAPGRRGRGGGAELDKLGQSLAAHHSELLRSFEALRAEVGQLRSQVSEVQRLLRDVG